MILLRRVRVLSAFVFIALASIAYQRRVFADGASDCASMGCSGWFMSCQVDGGQNGAAICEGCDCSGGGFDSGCSSWCGGAQRIDCNTATGEGQCVCPGGGGCIDN